MASRNIQSTSGSEIEGKSFENSLHHSGANPLLKAPMTSLVRRITVGDIGPWSTRAQHPHTVQDGAPALPGTPVDLGEASGPG
jgi:hypothetical protein